MDEYCDMKKLFARNVWSWCETVYQRRQIQIIQYDKIMALVFWDAKSILLFVYYEKGTITTILFKTFRHKKLFSFKRMHTSDPKSVG